MKAWANLIQKNPYGSSQNQVLFANDALVSEKCQLAREFNINIIMNCIRVRYSLNPDQQVSMSLFIEMLWHNCETARAYNLISVSMLP